MFRYSRPLRSEMRSASREHTTPAYGTEFWKKWRKKVGKTKETSSSSSAGVRPTTKAGRNRRAQAPPPAAACWLKERQTEVTTRVEDLASTRTKIDKKYASLPELDRKVAVVDGAVARLVREVARGARPTATAEGEPRAAARAPVRDGGGADDVSLEAARGGAWHRGAHPRRVGHRLRPRRRARRALPFAQRNQARPQGGVLITRKRRRGGRRSRLRASVATPVGSGSAPRPRAPSATRRGAARCRAPTTRRGASGCTTCHRSAIGDRLAQEVARLEAAQPHRRAHAGGGEASHSPPRGATSSARDAARARAARGATPSPTLAAAKAPSSPPRCARGSRRRNARPARCTTRATTPRRASSAPPPPSSARRRAARARGVTRRAASFPAPARTTCARRVVGRMPRSASRRG